MHIHSLCDAMSVSPQITPEDLQQIEQQGFKSLIINRPDGEEAGQPSFAEISEKASGLGLKTAYIPVRMGQPLTDALGMFVQEMADLEGPVLAYCRSGTRSVMLWAYSQRGVLPVATILDRAQAAGYDLSAHKLNLS